MEFKNRHLKGSKHTGLCSFLSPYHWRWIASHDLAVDRCIPLCLKTSGLSNRAEPPERLAVVWHAPCFLPAQQQQPARLPSFPAHLLACQPGVLCGSWAWQSWLQGSDGLLMVPSAHQPTRAGRKGEGDRCFYVPLVAPTSSPASAHTHAPALISAENWRKIRKGERKTNHGGYGLEGNKGPWWCDGMKTSLIKSAQ